MHSIEGVLGITVPFLFSAIIVIAVFYFRHARRRETELTIRLAIEKGQHLDPALIERLLENPQRNSSQRLQIWGSILIFVGIGLGVLHLVVGGDTLREGPMPGAVMTSIIGIGLLVASRFAKSDQPKLPPQA